MDIEANTSFTKSITSNFINSDVAHDLVRRPLSQRRVGGPGNEYVCDSLTVLG